MLPTPAVYEDVKQVYADMKEMFGKDYVDNLEVLRVLIQTLTPEQMLRVIEIVAELGLKNMEQLFPGLDGDNGQGS